MYTHILYQFMLYYLHNGGLIKYDKLGNLDTRVTRFSKVGQIGKDPGYMGSI